jgi:hypothetical protein
MSNGAGGWRGQPPPMEERKVAARQGRGRRLVGLLALFLAIAATVVGLFFSLRTVPAPVFQSLAIREYADGRLPVNAWAIQDGQLLEQRFGAKNSYAAQTGAKIMAELGGLRQARREPVVLHVCALALVSSGKVFLLPGDADPERPGAWIALDDVLARLRDCPAPAKLLILDIMRPMADTRLGVYADDVALKTEETLQNADLPFLVLCACSGGQTAQVSQELGQSVFAYYLDQGLAGHADGYGRSGREGGRAVRDQVVTVKELAEFVTARVDRWAWQNRGVRQTPALHGAGADFVLVRGEGSAGQGSAEPPADTAPAGYPAWLRGHWAQRDKWQPALRRLGPGLLRYLEAELLRAEARWRGGDEERAKKQLDRTLAEVAPDVQRVLDHRPPPVSSLRGLQGTSAAALTPDLRKLLFQSDNPSLKDEKDKAAKEEFDKAVKETQAKLAKTPKDAALAIFETAAASERLSQAHFLLLYRLLAGLEFKAAAGERGGPYAEVLFLERVKAFADRVQKSYFDWPTVEVHQALAATQLADAIVADLVAAPALRPWIAKDLDQADALRRKAEKDLFEGFPPWADVEGQFREAAALYREVRRRLSEVQAARAEWERALWLLPSLAPTLSAQGKDYEQEAAWDAAVAAAANLGARLRGAGGAPATGALDGVAGLRQSLNDLERSFAAREAACLTEQLGPEDHAEIEALLRSPLPGAAQREKLWKTGQDASLKLLHDTQAQDDADNQADQRPRLETLPADRGAGEREQRRRRWRGREALALLTLAGLADKLDKDVEAALQNNEEKSWQRFAETISNLWPGQATAELASAKTDRARADWLARLLAPFDLAKAGIEPRSHNPALALYRQEMAALLGHLAVRCHADAAGAGAALRTLYAAAAEAYEHEALRWR